MSRAFCPTDQEKRETTRSLGRRVHEQCAARIPAAGIPVSQYNVAFNLRDGALENLWRLRAMYKKYSRKGKLKEKTFMHTQ